MGIWYNDKRLDFFHITGHQVKRNSNSVAAVCMKYDLVDTGDGYRELRVKKYGETYNLCRSERFYDQPVSAGFMCTGVLVGEDIVATAAHFADETNVRELCFLFGYVMAEPITAVTRIPAENVYHGVEIFHREYDVSGENATGSDWTLVRLDRKVEGQEIAILSKSPVFTGQNLYVLGHPCGLPLKYVPGGMVKRIEKAYFTSELDLYSGNSGSPCFCAETHDMIGIVSRSDPRDFRWVADCCVSVVYPNKEIKSDGTRCIKVSEFNEHLFTGTNDKDEYVAVRNLSVSAHDKEFLKELLTIIEKNLSDTNFDIDVLCKELYSSRSTLFRKVKAITGETPNQFIQSYRLNRAAQLLGKKYGNVTEVAAAVGFPDQFYFSKCFKDKFGQSPKAYQSDYLKKNADKTREKQLDAPQNRDPKKKISIQVEFTLDELDREYISRVVATKSEHMFDFKDKAGSPQRDDIVKQVEMLYDPPIPLSSNEALKNFTLRELMQKMRKKIEKMRKDVR